MLAVSVILLILLSTTFVCDADSEDINCLNVKIRLGLLDHIQGSLVKSGIPKKPILGKIAIQLIIRRAVLAMKKPLTKRQISVLIVVLHTT